MAHCSDFRMSDTLGFVVVGAGWFGAKRIAALKKIKEASIEWIVDFDHEVGIEAAKSVDSEYTSDLEEALSSGAVDCVLVCTPNKTHPEVVIRAIKHGKHVLCEKPLARNVQEAKMIVDAAKNSSSLVKTGSNHRYFPNVMKAMEILREGQIGEPIFFRGSIGHNGEALQGRWFWNPELAGGGTFLDNGCHLLDISRELLGDLNECVGMISTTFWPVSPLEDNGFALYRNSEGKTALVQSSWIEWFGYMYFEVYGTEGFVIVDSRRTNRTLVGKRGEDHTTVYDYSDIPPKSHELELLDFMQHIRNGSQPRPSAEEGLRVLEMVDALYRSSEQGIRVRF